MNEQDINSVFLRLEEQLKAIIRTPHKDYDEADKLKLKIWTHENVRDPERLRAFIQNWQTDETLDDATREFLLLYEEVLSQE